MLFNAGTHSQTLLWEWMVPTLQ